MKRSFKSFAVGFLCGTLLLGSIPAMASTVRELSASFNGIKITLDSQEIVPTDALGNPVEPFVVDGTTYLPVRAVASAVGLDVAWDGETQTVVLTTPGAVTDSVDAVISKVLYDDDNVTIEFDRFYVRYPSDLERLGAEAMGIEVLPDSVAVFRITNKTERELTFQPGAISFDGMSYQFSGSEDVAAKSAGRVEFTVYEETIDIGNCKRMSGKVSVVDFSKDILTQSYDVSWTDVEIG